MSTTDAPAPGMSGEATAAWESLADLLSNLPIPAAPPRYPSGGTLVGVSLLDMALNLNHLARRSEKLVTVDRAQLSREVSVRVSLDRLTPEQSEAALAYGQLRDSAALAETASSTALGLPSAAADPEDEPPPLIWVPVARVSRRVAAPVRVYDTEGREVPRATQPELLPIVNAALLTLLDLILRSEADADVDGTALYRLLHRRDRARWLLQSAASEMVQGSKLPGRCQPPSAAEPTPDVRETRDLAKSVANSCLRHDSAFLELLHQASLEYLVVVGLSSAKREHYLSWTAPTLPALDGSVVLSTAQRFGRGLVPSGREFVVEYTTRLPRRLDSFHVVVEAEPGVRVREAVMTTEHDQLRAESLVRTFDQLAHVARSGRSTGVVRPFFEYEVSDAFTRLDDLVARRSDEWAWSERPDLAHATDAAGEHSPSSDGSRSGGSVAPDLPNAKARSLREAVLAMRQSDYSVKVGVDLSAPDELASVSKHVESLQLGKDLVSDDDPREHAAHLYWRQNNRRRITGSPTTPIATVHVVFSDDAPALIHGVLGWMAGLCAFVTTIGILLFGWSAWPWPATEIEYAQRPTMQVDALVAVLLIAPTAIFGRLDLPKTNTIAGQLRILDRVLGYLAIVLAGSLGLVLAARTGDGESPHTPFAVIFLLLVGFLGVACVDVLMSHRKRRGRRLAILDLPAWTRAGQTDPRDADARFRSGGAGGPESEGQRMRDAVDGE